MILLFQINPCASESVLALEHMLSFFECVLCDYYHHDVRTISAMILERIADARQRGSGLSLPPESLFSLASRIEDQLASAKQCTPGGARTPGWQAEPQTGLPLTRVCASPWTDGLQTGMVSLLVKAAAFHAPCSQAPYKLQEKFGDMQVVGGDASRPAQPKPRLLLANFNQQTVGVCQRGLEPPGAGRQGGSGLLLMRLSLALDSRTSTRSCRGVRCNMTVSGRWSMLYMGLEFGVCEITCTLLGVI